MEETRKGKSLRNISYSIGYQIFTLIMSFVTRTLFINTLGIDYLGISGLFGNILSVLSLAELGIGATMTYSLYKPLAEKDYEKIGSLLSYFKKIYFIIFLVVLTVGLSLLPVLDFIVNVETPIENLSIYYILYICDSAVSYLCVHKTMLLIADQNDYILKKIRIGMDIVRILLQVLVLILVKSFIVYLAVQIICSITNNVVGAFISSKKYSNIKLNNSLDKSEKSKIWNNVKSLFSYKIGGVILNNTDLILISIIVGTTTVGLYSNYYMPIKSITAFTSAIFLGIQASLGNLNTNSTPQKKYEIFKILELIAFIIYGFCFVCLTVLLQDFVEIWLGKEYQLSVITVYIIGTTYYITGFLYPIALYRETAGLFKHTKNILIYASIINLVFSIGLGYLWGIEGILISTIIARISTYVWFEPYKLFNLYFEQSPKKYYIRQVMNFLILIFIILVPEVTFKFIVLDNVYIRFAIKFAYCITVCPIVLLLVNRKKDEFIYLKNYSISLLKKIKLKR